MTRPALMADRLEVRLHGEQVGWIARGARATCEVTPHHLLLTDQAVREFGAGAKVNPPLRFDDDARALRDAVRDGTVDAFATDHAPHTAAEKSGDLVTEVSVGDQHTLLHESVAD